MLFLVVLLTDCDIGSQTNHGTPTNVPSKVKFSHGSKDLFMLFLALFTDINIGSETNHGTPMDVPSKVKFSLGSLVVHVRINRLSTGGHVHCQENLFRECKFPWPLRLNLANDRRAKRGL